MNCTERQCFTALFRGNLTVAGALHQPELFERALLTLLSPAERKDPAILRQFFATAREHLQSSVEIRRKLR